MTKLTAAQVRNITAPGRYHDGEGLYLNVAENGSKSWVQRTTINGKRAMKGLGGVRKVSLSEARKIAERNRAEIKAGNNPFDKTAKMAITELTEAITPTFRTAAGIWLENTLAKHPASAHQLQRTLELYAFPAFDRMGVDEITRPEVAGIINSLRRDGHTPTAKKLRGAMREVFRWAVAAGHRIDNPADDNLEPLLWVSSHVEKHHDAIHHTEVADALHKIHYGDGDMVCRLAMQFLIFTGVRTSEVRLATWGEIDGDVWRIPASRMKVKSRDHTVPLSIQAQEILRQARGLRYQPDEWGWQETPDPDDYIFVNPKNGKALGHGSLNKRARMDKLNCSPHGFRSSFTGWAVEQGYAKILIDMALSHAVGDKVDQAYFRLDWTEERRDMMQEWANFIDPLPF